jgi:hypothetical protein
MQSSLSWPGAGEVPPVTGSVVPGVEASSAGGATAGVVVEPGWVVVDALVVVGTIGCAHEAATATRSFSALRSSARTCANTLAATAMVANVTAMITIN